MQKEEYYMSLPGGMTKAEVQKEFELLFKDLHESDSPALLVNALAELSERQWHTYEPLVENLRLRVSSELKRLWLDSDANRIEVLFGIAARLGLVDFVEFVDSRDRTKFSPEADSAVATCLAELRDSISNPYSGM